MTNIENSKYLKRKQNRLNNKTKAGKVTVNSLVHILLIVLNIIWILPLLWLVFQSFRGESTGPDVTKIFPEQWTFNNYLRLFQPINDADWASYFGRWYLNTIIMAVCTCIISTFFVIMVSFAFSRLRFKSMKTMMSLVLILGMFPGFMSMIAVYFLLKTIVDPGDTGYVFEGASGIISMIVVYSASSGMGFFICKGFFDQIPKSLDECARVDGASTNMIFWKIILPLSKPIIVYTILMSFMGPWMDFMFIRVIIKESTISSNVAFGLWKMLNRERIGDYFTTFCSGAVLVAIPISTLFIIMQRFYVAGITSGADKG